MEITHDVAVVIACFGSLFWLHTHPTKFQREHAARSSHAEGKDGWN